MRIHHLLILCLGCLVSGPLCAQVVYQQEQLQLADVTGDEILQQLFLNTCQTGVRKCIQRENLPPQESQLRQRRFASENPIVPGPANRVIDNSKVYPLFDRTELLNRLQNIMREEAHQFPVMLGEKHLWTKKKSFFLSKIVVALATATSSRFMYVGKEIDLIKWIKTRPDNSVTVEELFHYSYVLNKGNVYLTLVTIENVLSDATFDPERENTLVNRKLTDLYAYSPNKFGDWYHFFGTMLAGYVEEPAQVIARLYGIYRKISRGAQAEKATMAADKDGAEMGVKLRVLVETEVRGRWAVLVKRLRVSATPHKKTK